MRIRPLDTVWTPLRRRPLAVLAIVAVIIVSGIVLGGFRIMANPDKPSCSPPNREEQKVQEAFLLSHVGDAQDLDWYIADCDDDGVATLEFTTARPPAAARDAFLTDTSCSPTTGPNAGEYNVTCSSGAAEVSILFEDTTVARASGMLVVP